MHMGSILQKLKWSGKLGQRAKMYPTQTDGYENDKTTGLFSSTRIKSLR